MTIFREATKKAISEVRLDEWEQRAVLGSMERLEDAVEHCDLGVAVLETISLSHRSTLATVRDETARVLPRLAPGFFATEQAKAVQKELANIRQAMGNIVQDIESNLDLWDKCVCKGKAGR